MGRFTIIVWNNHRVQGGVGKHAHKKKSYPVKGGKVLSDDYLQVKTIIVPFLRRKYPEHWIGVYDALFGNTEVMCLKPEGFKKRAKFEEELATPYKLDERGHIVKNPLNTTGKPLKSLYGKLDKPTNTVRPGKGRRLRRENGKLRVRGDSPDISWEDGRNLSSNHPGNRRNAE